MLLAINKKSKSVENFSGIIVDLGFWVFERGQDERSLSEDLDFRTRCEG